MPPQEIPLTLTPEQAAAGAVLNLPLRDGTTARLSLPPTRHGDLVRGRIAGQEILIRIRVAGAPPPARKGSPLGCLLALLVAAGVAAGIAALTDDDTDTTAGKRPTPTPTYSARPWTPAPLPTPDLPDLGTPTSAAPQPSPYDEGTCLNGTLPDSTTATRVHNIDEVACSADDAHYKVIQRFPFTTEMERCQANPRTEYAFSHSYTRNGVPINQYVYCLVGLGSYARR
ncbi:MULTISPECIES: hypothetical protein [Streptomyces]|uniref:LppU/SCO3897 family protein n=1 Tax=Streptomyces TaxID=1883 RepID=UPI00167BBC98|nr:MULTISPECIES: hypothetical protein [Streptomyces]MBD3579785.1 hypothetical protein [Streptomyces sp. KD18]GGS95135.1 hypothetical protein GCM10010286_20140 [Streptomyces toxytricini]